MLQSLVRWTTENLRNLRAVQRLLGGGCPGEEALASMGSRLPPGTNLPQLAGWLKELHDLAQKQGTARSRRILFFSVMPFWVDYCVPIALVLAARGDTVDFVHLPYTLFDRPEPGLTPPSPLSRLLPFAPLHPRLRICNLLHFRPARSTKEMEAAAHECSRFDPAYVFRRETVDLVNNEAMRQLFQFRLARNLDCIARLQTVMRRGYDSMLVAQGDIYEFGAAYQAAKLHGLRCISFAMGERKEAIHANHTTPCSFPDTEEMWEADEPHLLTPEREESVARFLWERETPNWEDRNYTWKGQIAPVETEEILLPKLGLRAGKPTALLCSSIAWDAAVLGGGNAYRHMSEWVVATVDWFRKRPDWQLIVRAHPGETYEPTSLEPVEGMIRAQFPQLPPNICIIKPDDPVNTYALLHFVKFGLVFVSTTGLEMSLRGVPVIVTGFTHYSRKGFTIDPRDPAEYFVALEKITSAPTRLTPRQVELARCYLYIYNHHVTKPFPWRVCYLEEGLEKWPLRRILAGECPDSFLRTFDYLAARHC